MSDTSTDISATRRRDAPDESTDEHVRQVRVPGSVTGFAPPGAPDEPPAPASPPASPPSESGWRLVRLRLRPRGGSGPARRARRRGGDVLPPPEQPPPARPGGGGGGRLLGLGVAVIAVVALLAYLFGGTDKKVRPRAPSRTVAVPALTSAPPARAATPTAFPFRAVPGAGSGLASATLRNVGARLELTVRTEIPNHPYAVRLIGSGGRSRTVLRSGRPGAAKRSLRLSWRALARYDSLVASVILPPARAKAAHKAKASHTSKAKKATHATVGHHAARGSKARARARAAARPRRPRTRAVLRLGVDRLVQRSDVRLTG